MYKNILIVIFLFSVFASGQVPRLQNMEQGLREDGKYHAWIYFTDKVKSIDKSSISQKALQRRNKVNPNKNYDWYDIDPSEEYMNKVLITGAKLRHQSRWLNAISIECTENELIEISYMPFVVDVKPINQYQRAKLEESSLPEKSLQKYGSINDIDYGGAKEQIEQINVHTAHDNGFYGQGVTVLMLDTGYNLDHPIFDSLNVIAEWDVINNDSTTKNEDGQDVPNQHNHGTSTFSVLGGYAPGSLIGPAFKADFLLGKTEHLIEEDITEEDDFISGLEWGEARGADVMSTSLGWVDWYTWEDMDGNTSIATKAIDVATSLGVVCIASAGNENGNYWDAVTPPADAYSVISVGAVNNEGLIAGFSSRGPTADDRIKPEVCARGVDTYAAHGNGSSYYSPDGTSYAAPLVAGAAAVLLSARPTWTPGMVREVLLETASQSQSPNNDYGWGIIDVWAAINYDVSSLFTPELRQNFPNPFNPNTTIEYELRQSSNVKLVIFDILGREITTLINRFEPSGMKSVEWNGTNDSGYAVSTGVYFYSLIIGDKSLTKKMLMIK